MATNLVSNIAEEVLTDGGTANARVSTIAEEVLSSGATNPNARVSTLAIEVLNSVAVFVPPAASSQPIIICVT